jgi:hypothetical protein
MLDKIRGNSRNSGMENRVRLKKIGKNHRIIDETIYMENSVKSWKSMKIIEKSMQTIGKLLKTIDKSMKTIKKSRKTSGKSRLTRKIGPNQLDRFKNWEIRADPHCSALIRADPR